MTIEQVREMLGWCLLINVGVLFFWFLSLVFAHGLIMRVHTKLVPMSEKKFNVIHYKGIMYYKIGLGLFVFVPYLALVIMTCDHVG